MTATIPESTSVAPILNRVEAALGDDLVPAEIFNNEAVFGAELDKIFSTCWVFVAHESEIPKPGDFVQRRIGLYPGFAGESQRVSWRNPADPRNRTGSMPTNSSAGSAERIQTPIAYAA
ncbi:hypothetical protein ACIHDR_24660 [Nocardia sp. NPDC052278]|uniref:hypothetical protein n=1 Tax=unclassified Nocardia TaxID=2637762 RepID=UPI003677FD7E